jgi:hypothetical protein
MKNTMSWLFGVSFLITAMLFSGWMYMLIISIFSPISYKNAFTISLILNAIGLAFNHGRTINDRRK